MSAGKQRPTDHVALNVALYGRGARRWTMTERGDAQLQQSARELVIGPSAVRWTGQALEIDIDEVGAVFGEAVRGRVCIFPDSLAQQGFPLDPHGRHRWQPVAPRATIEARFERPGLRWSGDAYVDSNFGSEPMETRFRDWQWSRAHVPGGSAIFYEGVRLDGSRFDLALHIDRQGRAEPLAQPPLIGLRRSAWQMPRATRSDGPARILKTWEDAPFYARTALQTRLFGADVLGVHESLSLTRFIHPVVQWMLPYRMPRRV